MNSYYKDQLANHEMDEAYNEYIDSLSEEEYKQEMIRSFIPQAKRAADAYLNRILGKIQHPEHSHPYNLERWYRRRDTRFKPFFHGYMDGAMRSFSYFVDVESTYPTLYTAEEISAFAEILANEKVPDNNEKRNIRWIASYDGYIRGFKDNLPSGLDEFYQHLNLLTLRK